MKEARELKIATKSNKWIAYEEVLDFLKWQFDEDFADQQIQTFHVVKGKIYGNKRNR